MLSRSLLFSAIFTASLLAACDEASDAPTQPSNLEGEVPIEQTVTLEVDEPVTRDTAAAVTEVVVVHDADGTSVWGHDAQGDLVFEADAPGTAVTCPGDGDGGGKSLACPSGYKCCEPAYPSGCLDCRPTAQHCP